MAIKTNNSLSPLKPYDESKWESFNLYDNMTFVWDSEMEKHHALESGNVIKGYRCKVDEPYEIRHE